MTTNVNNLAKQAVHDKLESQINTAEAKLNTLKARAETAKANVELKAITELLTAPAEAAQTEEVGWRTVGAGESQSPNTHRGF